MADMQLAVTGEISSETVISGAFQFGASLTVEAHFGIDAGIRAPRFSLDGEIEAGAVLRTNPVIYTPRFIAFSICPAGVLLKDTDTTLETEQPILVPPFAPRYTKAQIEWTPLWNLDATLTEEIELSRATYTMNLVNESVTEYNNFPFDFVVQWQGRHMAAGPDGIYELEGIADVQAPIMAEFETSVMDFGSTLLKRLPYVYVGSRNRDDARLSVGVSPDEERYRMSQTTRLDHNRRARMPRGIYGRYWSIKIQNQDGNRFYIDNVEPVPDIMERRI